MKKMVISNNNISSNAAPLFFNKTVPISYKSHNNCGLYDLKDFKFAKNTNIIPININELASAAKFYPIIFTEKLTFPLALVGFDNENYFINSDNQWINGTHIPAYVRKHPFIWAHDLTSKQLVFCIDESADNFSHTINKDVHPLFYKDGEISDFTKSALEFIKLFQYNHNISIDFTKALIENDLLVANTANFSIKGTNKQTISSFMTIDEKKFCALSDNKFLEFRNKGWLAPIYFILMSSHNWLRLCNMKAEK